MAMPDMTFRLSDHTFQRTKLQMRTARLRVKPNLIQALSDQQLRILLSFYFCSPFYGSNVSLLKPVFNHSPSMRDRRY